MKNEWNQSIVHSEIGELDIQVLMMSLEGTGKPGSII